jgi:hypothetical protein
VRDVHSGVAALTSKGGHCVTGKRLTSGNTCIFASATGDNVGAAVHIRLRLIDITRVKGRKDLVAVSVSEHAGPVDVFLITER